MNIISKVRSFSQNSYLFYVKKAKIRGIEDMKTTPKFSVLTI